MAIGTIGVLFCYAKLPSWTPVFVILINLGLGMSFVVQNDLVVLLFAPAHQILVSSAAAFVSIFLSSLTPLLAMNIDQPTPLYILLVTSTVGIITSCSLKVVRV